MSEVKNVNCGCEKVPNQVCDICQGLSKPWRQQVFPDGPWSYVWHGSGEDRGYTLKHGRDIIAYVGDQISTGDMQDIAWAHNVQFLELQKELEAAREGTNKVVKEAKESADRMQAAYEALRAQKEALEQEVNVLRIALKAIEDRSKHDSF